MFLPAGWLHLLLPGPPDEEDGPRDPGEQVGADAQVLRSPVGCNNKLLLTHNIELT